LKIEPVAEADAGEYQCQVGAAADGSPPLRSRSARLVVQIPPGPPKIIYHQDSNERSKDNSGDHVVSVRNGETIVLECESTGGRPAASLEWWQDEPGRLPAQLDAVTTRTAKDDSDKTESIRTVSSLRLRVSSSEHHNHFILCGASNVASNGQQQLARVRLEVLSPPRVELGISSGVGPLREGDSVTLHCQAVEGHPPADAYAWYRDGRQLTSDTREFLTFPRLDRSLHGVVLGCEASNGVGVSPVRATKQLSLQYSPVIVQQPEPLVVGREGEAVQLSCRADSNPPARYTWTKEPAEDGNIVRGGEQSAPIGFSATLQLVVNRHTVGRYRCQALVEGWSAALSKPARIGVLERPKIEMNSNGGGDIVEYAPLGTDAELTCRIRSLTAEVNITWDYKGKVATTHFRYLHSTPVSILYLKQ
jgi:hypothetical protein